MLSMPVFLTTCRLMAILASGLRLNDSAHSCWVRRALTYVTPFACNAEHARAPAFQSRSKTFCPRLHQVTMEFKRESRSGKVIYFDVELVRGSPSFLKLLQRCHSLAQVKLPSPIAATPRTTCRCVKSMEQSRFTMRYSCLARPL